MHHVVAGALVRDDRVLLGHRSPSRRWYPDVWDLPGGHVEAGESEREALVRELQEELGIHVAGSEAALVKRMHVPAGDKGGGLRLGVWRLRRWRGEPANLCPDEHDELRWFAADDIASLDLAHPAYPPLLHTLLAEDCHD